MAGVLLFLTFWLLGDPANYEAPPMVVMYELGRLTEWSETP